MLGADTLTNAVGAIRSASSLTETTFVQVGKTLEASIEILTRLTASFETLLLVLKGDKLDQAFQALSLVAVQVSALGNTLSEGSAGFVRLQHVADAIAQRIARMNESVRTAGSLAINSKIAAADIRVPGVDFVGFAQEIGLTLSVTRTSLKNFGVELQAVRTHVAAAHASQVAFETHEDEAFRSIPARLTATVGSLALQHKRAAQASLSVRQRSDLVRRQISSAISALQAADITRQRLEHADYALGLLAETHEPLATTRSHEVAGDAGPGEHKQREHEQREREQRALTTTTCRLQSAQLADAAQVFDRETRQIIASLKSFAAEARALRSLGSSAYGTLDHGRSSFIVQLEGQVGEALVLCESFGTARARAVQAMTSVADATVNLCGHLKDVQSLEADIHIMGLNTTFKCARVGREGLALGLIAQELRAYGNAFATEANALLGDVESVSKITGSLIGTNDTDTTPLIAGAMQAMRDSLVTLQQVGQTLGDALAELDSDSQSVVSLLEQTVAHLGTHDDIGQSLREAAALLAAMSPPGELPLADLTPSNERLLALMEAGYTMANERVIHDRVLGRTSKTAPAAATAPQPELEDMLF
jgi:hypothetical protein